jgi:hypothetical protein
MEKKMLREEEKEKMVSMIVPLLNGKAINDALDILDYTKGFILDFGVLDFSSVPSVRAPVHKAKRPREFHRK